MNITASTKIELMEILSSTDISVPPRENGRTKDHVERWSMYRTLATLMEYSVLGYPSIIDKA
jgi:hypothetical protein